MVGAQRFLDRLWMLGTLEDREHVRAARTAPERLRLVGLDEAEREVRFARIAVAESEARAARAPCRAVARSGRAIRSSPRRRTRTTIGLGSCASPYDKWTSTTPSTGTVSVSADSPSRRRRAACGSSADAASRIWRASRGPRTKSWTIAPADEERDGDDLHDQHGVEVAAGIVERAVRDRELHTGETATAIALQPNSRQPRPSSRRACALVSPASVRAERHGDEDEDDRAADPHRGGQHMQGKEDSVHSETLCDARVPPIRRIWHVPRLALLAIVVLAISPAATGAETPAITISGRRHGHGAFGSGAASFFDSASARRSGPRISLGNLEGTLATRARRSAGRRAPIASRFGRRRRTRPRSGGPASRS